MGNSDEYVVLEIQVCDKYSTKQILEIAMLFSLLYSKFGMVPYIVQNCSIQGASTPAAASFKFQHQRKPSQQTAEKLHRNCRKKTALSKQPPHQQHSIPIAAPNENQGSQYNTKDAHLCFQQSVPSPVIRLFSSPSRSQNKVTFIAVWMSRINNYSHSISSYRQQNNSN